MKKSFRVARVGAAMGALALTGMAGAGTAFSNLGITQVPATGVPGAGATLPLANTLVVSPNHVGHLLVVPYFSTQDGNVSLLNIVNTDRVNGKAVKVRYRGAANSDAVHSFTVMLSPGDVWAANVSQEGGVSTLLTNDTSCTLPASVKGAFNPARAQGKAAQTLEGTIEIINMADIPPHPAGTMGQWTSDASRKNALYEAIKHVNGTPDCQSMPSQDADLTNPPSDMQMLDANSWTSRGYNFPTGGLMAHWSIVNLSKAGSFTGTATAIAARAARSLSDRAVANLVFSPQVDVPQPSDAAALTAGTHPSRLTADPLLAGGVYADGSAAAPALVASKLDFPDLSTPYVSSPKELGNAIRQEEALSAALDTLSISNEFMTSPAVSFATDWTMAMPTRRYNVALDYAGAAGRRAVYARTLDFTTTPPSLPATYLSLAATYFTPTNTAPGADGSQLCVRTGLVRANDTEERDNGPFFSPMPPSYYLNLCGEVSVVTFNNASGSVLGAKLATLNYEPKNSTSGVFTDGWVTVQMQDTPTLGLPVIGHAFAKALSSTANLGGLWPHSTHRTAP